MPGTVSRFVSRPFSRGGEPLSQAVRATKGEGAEFNGALTTPAHSQIMMKRDEMGAVIEGLQKEQGLLAAFLEATHKIDWRALRKPAPIRETPKPLDVEASFVLRRANLARASDRSLVPEDLQRDEE